MADQTIYLVRHGETVWNREGRAQARRAGQMLRQLLDGTDPWVLRFSPLGRARQTAAIISDLVDERIAAQHPDAVLKEVSWGAWQGLTRAEIARRAPAAWAEHEADSWRFVPPDGESYAMLAARARSWLECVAPEPRLVVVGHGAWGRALRGVYLGLELEQAMALDEPQDAIFRLNAGTIARISTS